MAYELIAGVQQDHKGRLYQYGRYPNGKTIQVPYQESELSGKLQAMCEPVMVESHGYPAAVGLFEQNKDNPGWPDEQRRKVEAIIARGPVYQSIVFFQLNRSV